jgi:hypothetical protein
LVHRANRLLDGIDAKTSKRARRVLSTASSVLDAVERAGLLEELGGAANAEARAALAALPITVDAALLAVLKAAVQRRLPVVIQWKPGHTVELQVWEAVEGRVGHVGVMLITPYARDMSVPG